MPRTDAPEAEGLLDQTAEPAEEPEPAAAGDGAASEPEPKKARKTLYQLYVSKDGGETLEHLGQYAASGGPSALSHWYEGKQPELEALVADGAKFYAIPQSSARALIGKVPPRPVFSEEQ